MEALEVPWTQYYEHADPVCRSHSPASTVHATAGYSTFAESLISSPLPGCGTLDVDALQENHAQSSHSMGGIGPLGELRSLPWLSTCLFEGLLTNLLKKTSGPWAKDQTDQYHFKDGRTHVQFHLHAIASQNGPHASNRCGLKEH